MTKAVKILNKYQIKDMLLTGKIQFENFYKEELIQICKVANEMIENLLIENQKQKEVIDKLTFIKNRARAGATQETINKLAITFVNAYLKEVE